MSNILVTNQIRTVEYLRRLKNKLAMFYLCSTTFESAFNVRSVMKSPLFPTGQAISIRKPIYLNGYAGPDITGVSNPVIQYTEDLSISFNDVVPVAFTDVDMTLNLDDFTKNFAEPGGAKLANMMERNIINSAMNRTYNWVGTPGTPLTSFGMVQLANNKLNLFGVDDNERFLVVNVNDYGNIVTAVQNNFNEVFNKQASQSGRVTRISNFDAMMNQNNTTHTVGAYTSSVPLISGSTASGATTLLSNGWVGSTGVLTQGDRFTISGVNSVNPESKLDTGQLAQFIVTAPVNAASGVATIPIYPYLSYSTTDPYQNVTNAPSSGAAINILGASGSKYNVGFAMNKEAIQIVVIDLMKPPAAVMCERARSEVSKLSLRMTGYYLGDPSLSKYRLEDLYGIQVFGEYGCAIIT